MKHFFAFFLLSLSLNLFSQTNTTLRGTYTFPGVELANLWGYADGNGNEYALVGTQLGMTIINVTSPDNPTLVANIVGPTSDWREITTYGNYAYVVTEGTTGTKKGLMIVNLSYLPNIDENNPNHVRIYTGDGAITGQFTKAHALQVDEAAGFLYLFGTNLYGGRPVILNLNTNPFFPTYAGYVNTSFTGANYNYVHDGYANNNMLYAGHIYGGFFSIVNTTNKANPVLVATQNTPSLFTHNTWLNGSTLFTTDEKTNSYLASYDISNTDNIKLLDKIQATPGSGSIVHNTYIINNYAVTSWYTDGFTIVDGTRPDNLVQVGNYDTYPGGSGNGFFGCWGVYPYLPSGNIIASNINDAPSSSNGKLFVVTPNYVRACYLEGIVTDASNSNPINGATVQIVASPSQTESTISTGSYKMGRVQGGTYTVSVSKTNYQTYTTQVSLANSVLTTLNVALQPLVLPVELTRFSARAEGTSALLEWETAAERDNAGFEIQHSADGTNWKIEGFVSARAEGSPSSKYVFEVKDLPSGIHFFRLRQTDLDGGSTLSNMETVRIGKGKVRILVQPTIVSDACDILLSNAGRGDVQVEIFRTDGQSTGKVWSLQSEDEYKLQLSLAELSSGTYFVRVQVAGEVVTATFVKE